MLPSINFLLAEGFDTPKAAGPKKKLYFATPASVQADETAAKFALYNSLNSSSDFAASPGDSLVALKGSPVLESPMSGLNELFDFKDSNQFLVAEAEAADARLMEAEQTLADLRSNNDESAASTLMRMGEHQNKEEANRKLKLHLAEQQQKIAEAEASIKRLLAGR